MARVTSGSHLSRRRMLGGMGALAGVLLAGKTLSGPAIWQQPASFAAPNIDIKIGLLSPFTSGVQTFGASIARGFQVAVDEAKEKGVNITTVVIDDQNDPAVAVAAAKKMIEEEKVKAIVGSVTSPATIAVSEIAQSAKVVLMAPIATSPLVTVANGKRKDFVFRASFIDSFQGTAMAKFALGQLGAKSAAVLYDDGNEYSRGLAEYFQSAFTAGGGDIKLSTTYKAQDEDFSGVLMAVAEASPDFLFLPDNYNRVNLIARQAKEQGIRAILGGGDAWDSDDLDTGATEGAYFCTHYSDTDTRPEVQAWVAKFQAKHNQIPDGIATTAYDATNLLVAAILKAGGDDPTQIRAALAGLKDVPAVTGTVTFDADGNASMSAVIEQVRDGKHVVAAIINP